MKIAKILITLCIAFALIGCEQKLPYPLDEVQQGVLIDISKTPNTDMTLSAGVLEDNNISVTLNIPWQQGDYSHLKEVELMCVYLPAQGAKRSVIYKQGISLFPTTINIDMEELCMLLGIQYPEIGDRMDFVPNVILKSGLLIPGWNSITDTYNNTAFTGWQVNFGTGSRAYSYRARYTAYAPFYQEHYQGVVICDEDGWIYEVYATPISELPDPMPAGATAADIYGIEIEGIWDDDCFLKIWINKLNFEVIIPNQVIIPSWCYGSYGCYSFTFRRNAGELDSLNEIIEFDTDTLWGPYTFGIIHYILYFNR